MAVPSFRDRCTDIVTLSTMETLRGVVVAGEFAAPPGLGLLVGAHR
ncbi:hypothetical protein [Nocardia xishanensis]|nr:hypothetical protein [Nocardia xishanensis]